MSILLSVLFSILSAFSVFVNNADYTTSAEKQSQNDVSSFASVDTKIDEEKVENLFTSLALAVSSPETGKVAATLKNTFTLFSSTVPVRLYLYSSLIKTTDIAQMTLEDYAYSDDLNMGDSISVTSSTHGENRYWVGYAVYYTNTEQAYQTDPAFYYADGTYNPAY